MYFFYVGQYRSDVDQTGDERDQTHDDSYDPALPIGTRVACDANDLVAERNGSAQTQREQHQEKDCSENL